MKTKKLKRMHMAFKWVYNAGLPLYETLKNMKEFRKDKSTKKEFDKIYESQPWIMADATYNKGDTIKHRVREFKVSCAHGHKIEVKEIMKTKKHKVKIPEGYEFEKSIIGNCYKIEGSQRKLMQIWFTPIAKDHREYFDVKTTYCAGDIVFFNDDRYIFNPNISAPQGSTGSYPNMGYGWRIDKKELPKTWEEYTVTNDYPAWLYDKDVPDRYKALGKLEILRDVYNDGWVPDWGNYYLDKYCIVNKAGTIMDVIEGPICHTLAFKSAKVRGKFLSNFRDLIKQAKPLL